MENADFSYMKIRGVLIRAHPRKSAVGFCISAISVISGANCFFALSR